MSGDQDGGFYPVDRARAESSPGYGFRNMFRHQRPRERLPRLMSARGVEAESLHHAQHGLERPLAAAWRLNSQCVELLGNDAGG
jgi:hypothetical protein